MTDLISNDGSPEPTKPAEKPTISRAAALGTFAATMAVGVGIVFLCLSGISDAMKPGLAHYNQGNYAAAETDFRKFNQDSYTSNEPRAHYYLGLCLLHEAKFEEGRTEIKWAYDRTGGKDMSGVHHGAKKLLKALDELPASPTAAQTQEWQLKHLPQHLDTRQV